MTALSTFARTTGAWIDRVLVLKLLTLIHTLSGRALRKRLSADWKETALADFSDWLDSLDPEQPLDEPLASDTGDEPGPDLYTLVAEFISLKKEIQLQNREQSRQIKGLKDFNAFAGQGRQILDDLAVQVNRIQGLEGSIREKATDDILRAFLDVRAPLARGALFNTRRPALLTRRKKILPLLEGYGIALRKFDQALAELDTVAIDTAGKAFDPDTMTALDACPSGSCPPGTVAEEISGGFMRRGKVLRPAGVVVYTQEKDI